MEESEREMERARAGKRERESFMGKYEEGKIERIGN